MPRVGKRDKHRLEAGMAITIEPGVYLEGFGGIRIEDTVVVTETGCRVLTPTGKELREVLGGRTPYKIGVPGRIIQLITSVSVEEEFRDPNFL